MQTNSIIVIENLEVKFADKIILHDLNLKVRKGEVLGIVGGSGSGKTTLLRSMLMLIPVKGNISILGKNIITGNAQDKHWVRCHWGMMFQHGALFSSLTVLENVMFPLLKETSLSPNDMQELAYLKIAMVGLKPEAASRYPSELSGGMKKRAAIARALALDPELLFLDEPTAGLDPHGASELDELILSLKNTLELTVVMVTHDLDTLWRTTDRIAFLGQGRVLDVAPISEMMHSKEAMIDEYFSDVRAKMAQEKYDA